MLAALVTVAGGILGGASARRKAKRQAEAEKQALRIQYNFSMNDSERELFYNREQLLAEAFQRELEKNELLTNISYGIKSKDISSQTVSNMERMVYTQDFFNKMKEEVNLNKTLEEYNRYKENERFNTQRGIQSANNSVPSFFSTVMGSALQGVSQAASIYYGSKGGG